MEEWIMPTYEYECESCGFTFERRQGMTAPPPYGLPGMPWKSPSSRRGRYRIYPQRVQPWENWAKQQAGLFA
jgi:rubredoxin